MGAFSLIVVINLLNSMLCQRGFVFSRLLRKSVHSSSRASEPCQKGLDMDDLIHSKLADFSLFLNESVFRKCSTLGQISQYYFHGKGKFFRPKLVAYISQCCNDLQKPHFQLNQKQLKLAYITEMIHTSSLIHDDVVDNSDTRRSYPSAGSKFGDSAAIFAGNLLMAKASIQLASLENPVITKLLTQVIEDLVAGELMQLGVKNSPDERVSNYLEKS